MVAQKLMQKLVPLIHDCSKYDFPKYDCSKHGCSKVDSSNQDCSKHDCSNLDFLKHNCSKHNCSKHNCSKHDCTKNACTKHNCSKVYRVWDMIVRNNFAGIIVARSFIVRNFKLRNMIVRKKHCWNYNIARNLTDCLKLKSSKRDFLKYDCWNYSSYKLYCSKLKSSIHDSFLKNITEIYSCPLF